MRIGRQFQQTPIVKASQVMIFVSCIVVYSITCQLLVLYGVGVLHIQCVARKVSRYILLPNRNRIRGKKKTTFAFVYEHFLNVSQGLVSTETLMDI